MSEKLGHSPLSSYCCLYCWIHFTFSFQVSVAFSTAFGSDTEGARWIVGYLLEKVINNLSVWSSEADLANDTVELLVTLVERRER